MLAKAEREFERLHAEFNVDNVFNFFVTAYHIQDYIKNTNAIPQLAREKFLADIDLKDCQDLCNKGKHLLLTNRADPTTFVYSGTFGGAPFGALPFHGGDKWMLFTGDREVDVEWLAERVIGKWRDFLETHGV